LHSPSAAIHPARGLLVLSCARLVWFPWLGCAGWFGSLRGSLVLSFCGSILCCWTTLFCIYSLRTHRCTAELVALRSPFTAAYISSMPCISGLHECRSGCWRMGLEGRWWRLSFSCGSNRAERSRWFWPGATDMAAFAVRAGERRLRACPPHFLPPPSALQRFRWAETDPGLRFCRHRVRRSGFSNQLPTCCAFRSSGFSWILVSHHPLRNAACLR